MTAIAGVWNLDGNPLAGESCARMLAAQSLYGPDRSDRWSNGAVAMARALLRTVPEDRFDRQPLTGAGGKLTLVADVRLDNREELGEALGILPAAAASMCDAQLVLAAWERWGERAFARLVGDYALALWDAGRGCLVLARDHLGMRPLYYHCGARFVAFASMPKGLHALPEIPYAPDEASVTDLLALLPETGPGSFFAGISRVEPGHYVTITSAGARTQRHWEPGRETLRLGSSNAYAEGLREHLDRAVAACLRGADGQVAAHLSGGRDSSAVTATAARLMAPSGGRVTAFTSVPREGYDGPVPQGRIADEGPLAAATAALYPNVDHVLVRSGKRHLLDSLDRDFFLTERPIFNLCNQHWVSAINDAARERGLGILLTGHMGNVTISYSGAEALAELAGKGRWLRLYREGGALVEAGHANWREIAVAGLGPWMPSPVWRGLRRMFGQSRGGLARYSAIHPERRRQSGIDRRRRALGIAFESPPWRDSRAVRLMVLHRADPGNYYKGALGGWKLDVRDPTADRRLIEFCLSIPAEEYLRGGQPAALAARAFADRLPEAVLAGRGKGLQAADWHEALTADRETLRREWERLGEVPAAAAMLDLPRVAALIEDWPNGDWNSDELTAAYRTLLLRATAIGHFMRKASASNA